MSEFNTILLFGGETKNENMPVGFYDSTALFQIRCKPVILWQLLNMKKHGIKNCIIVVCKENKKLIEYLNNFSDDVLQIKTVTVKKNKSILYSLKSGLKKSDRNKPSRIILGDTYIPDSIDNEQDVLFTSKEFYTSGIWCLCEKSNDKLFFYDKLSIISLEGKEVLTGYYSVSDTRNLLNACRLSLLFSKQD